MFHKQADTLGANRQVLRPKNMVRWPSLAPVDPVQDSAGVGWMFGGGGVTVQLPGSASARGWAGSPLASTSVLCVGKREAGRQSSTCLRDTSYPHGYSSPAEVSCRPFTGGTDCGYPRDCATTNTLASAGSESASSAAWWESWVPLSKHYRTVIDNQVTFIQHGRFSR